MSDTPDNSSNTKPAPADRPNQFEDEPVWVDVMKSMGCGLVMILLTVIVGGALGVAIMAPWGRASFDCSIYCVIREYFQGFF